MKSIGEILDLDFEVEYVEAGEVRRARFADLLRRPTVVSIYMRNNTSSCDRQIDSLAASAGAIVAAGADLIALSRDTAASNLKYAAKKELPYRLVADKEDRFARAADAIVEKKMYGKSYDGPARAAFFLSPRGEVLGLIAKVDPKNHGAEVLRVVKGEGDQG
jgi:thioredoxin-dependent peroxiredoxin